MDIFNHEESEGKATCEWTKIDFPGHSHSWEDLEFLKKNWDGPIVLKGFRPLRMQRK
jgi:lactate 2-monooxygenase